jgi:hypothetical protein
MKSGLFLTLGVLCLGLQAAQAVGTTELSSADWKTIREAWVTGRQRFVERGTEGFGAYHVKQNWGTHFDAHGFLVHPDRAPWTWGLNLRSVLSGAWQWHSDAEGVKGEVSAEGRLEFRRDALFSEWFLNEQEGLEQGWTFFAKPEGAGAWLSLVLEVRGNLHPDVSSQAVRFKDTAGGTCLIYDGLKAWDADGRALPVRFVADQDGRFVVQTKIAGAQFPVTIDPLAQQAYIKASNTDPSDRFGNAVAIDGNTVVVGASEEDSLSPGVNGDQSDNSKFSVGAVYVFVRRAGRWQQEAYLKASNPDEFDRFGESVAISGDTVVVGAFREDSAAAGVNGDGSDNSLGNSGAAYVFVRSGNQWRQEAYLKASDPSAGSEFGAAVGISGDTLVVSSWRESSLENQAGAAYVFTRRRGRWSQQAKLVAPFMGPGLRFGKTVGIDGDTIAVGADGDNSGVPNDPTDTSASGAGAAHVFVRKGKSWRAQAYLKAWNPGTADFFGEALSLSGDSLLVGAPGEDSSYSGINNVLDDDDAMNSGAAYLYVREGEVWTQQAYLKARVVGAGDQFGHSVAIRGDLAVVGAPNEDSNAIGVNGNANNNDAENAGAAYVFARYGTEWVQLAYLKSNKIETNANFGWSVAVDGGTVLSAAIEDASNATGIDGNPFNSAANDSGALHVFSMAPLMRSLAQRNQAAPGAVDVGFGNPTQAVAAPNGTVAFESALSGTGAKGGANRGMFSKFGLLGNVGFSLQKQAFLQGMGFPEGARVSSFLAPLCNQNNRIIYQIRASGGGLKSASNQALLRDNGAFVFPLLRSGLPLAELGGASVSSIREVVQHRSDNRLGLNFSLSRNNSLGVSKTNDSGLLFIDHNGALIDSPIREGQSDPAGGTFGEFSGRAALYSGAAAHWIAKSINSNGTVDRVFSYDFVTQSQQAGEVLGGASPLGVSAALGGGPNVKFRSLLAVNAAGVRATLSGISTTFNEGIWQSGTGSLILLKGDDVNPVLHPGLKIKRITRYWEISNPEVSGTGVLAWVQLSGTGVTSRNNQALLLQFNDIRHLLLRTGDQAPGISENQVTIKRFNAVEVDPATGQYSVLGTLSGASSGSNLALWAGRALNGNNAFRQVRRPLLQLRKGAVYQAGDAVPASIIRSISLKQASETTGASARGNGQVLAGETNLVAILTGDRSVQDLLQMRLTIPEIVILGETD